MFLGQVSWQFVTVSKVVHLCVLFPKCCLGLLAQKRVPVLCTAVLVLVLRVPPPCDQTSSVKPCPLMRTACACARWSELCVSMLTDPFWGENENLVGECMGRNQIMIMPFAELDEEVLMRKVIPFEAESGTLVVCKQRDAVVHALNWLGSFCKSKAAWLHWHSAELKINLASLELPAKYMM